MITGILNPNAILRGRLNLRSADPVEIAEAESGVEGIKINGGVIFRPDEDGIVDVWIAEGVGVDSALDETSGAPVENRVIAQAIGELTDSSVRREKDLGLLRGFMLGENCLEYIVNLFSISQVRSLSGHSTYVQILENDAYLISRLSLISGTYKLRWRQATAATALTEDSRCTPYVKIGNNKQYWCSDSLFTNTAVGDYEWTFTVAEDSDVELYFFINNIDPQTFIVSDVALIPLNTIRSSVDSMKSDFDTYWIQLTAQQITALQDLLEED